MPPWAGLGTKAPAGWRGHLPVRRVAAAFAEGPDGQAMSAGRAGGNRAATNMSRGATGVAPPGSRCATSPIGARSPKARISDIGAACANARGSRYFDLASNAYVTGVLGEADGRCGANGRDILTYKQAFDAGSAAMIRTHNVVRRQYGRGSRCWHRWRSGCAAASPACGEKPRINFASRLNFPEIPPTTSRPGGQILSPMSSGWGYGWLRSSPAPERVSSAVRAT